MSSFISTIRMFLWMLVVTGVFYPLFITAFCQIIMKDKANGSILTHNEKVVGSSLIAQKFESAKYFWSRPSATDFNTLASGGSNLGPTSAELKKIVEERKATLLLANPTMKEVTSDLLFASGSGLDPHITLKAAYFQIDRIAAARGFNVDDKKDFKNLVDSAVEHREFWFLGEKYINVLKLNCALDEYKQ